MESQPSLQHIEEMSLLVRPVFVGEVLVDLASVHAWEPQSFQNDNLRPVFPPEPQNLEAEPSSAVHDQCIR